MPGDTEYGQIDVDSKAYQATGFWRYFLFLCGVLLAAGGVAGVWFSATVKSPLRVWLAGLCFGLLLLGVYTLLSLFRSKVILFADHICVQELTRRKVLYCNEIRGWRIGRTSPACLVLEPRNKPHHAVKIALIFPLDERFLKWLEPLTSLDDEDAEASESEILNDRAFGENDEQRLELLLAGRRFAKGLSIVSAIIALWGMFYPYPYELAILALVALPVVAVEKARRSRGLFRIDEEPNDVHPSVALAFFLPGSVLALRALLDYEVLGSFLTAVFCVAVSLILILIAYNADPAVRARKFKPILLFALGLMYGYGVTIEANCLLDHSPGIPFEVTVEGKHISSGKHTTYRLELPPWGPKSEPNTIAVGQATYKWIEKGDVVILTLRKGALGIRWFYMRSWQRGNEVSSHR